MPFETLKFEPGVSRQSARPDRAGQIASALGQFAELGVKQHRTNTLVKDREAKKAAITDLVQNTVNPDRVERDMMYGGTVLRNTIMQEHKARLDKLKDPNSPENYQDPQEYAKGLQNEAKEFYAANKGSKFAAINAEIFSQYTLANQQSLVAQQSLMYKQNQKLQMQNQAAIALGSLPPMNQEAFDLNTFQLIDQAMPANVFTTQERLTIGMGAAINAAREGDRRLLDFMETHYHSKDLAPRETLLGEKEYSDEMAKRENDLWNTRYKGYRELVMNGLFTKEMWDELILDQDVLDRMGGRSTIDSWLNESLRNRHGAILADNYVDNFMRGQPLVGATQKQFDESSMSAYDAIQQKHPGNPLAADLEYSQLLAIQGQVDGNLQTIFANGLGRVMWSPDMANSPEFQRYFTMAEMLKEHMGSSQFQKQLGEAAYDNFAFMRDLLRFNGNDFAGAATQLAAASQNRRDNPMKMQLSGAERERMTELADDIVHGQMEHSDPETRKFLGLVSKSSNAMMTGPVTADLHRQAEILVLQGMDPRAAMDHAAEKVAAKYKWYGNEMHFTAGADMNIVAGYPAGTTDSQRQESIDDYAKTLGLDGKDISVQIIGQNMVLRDREGNVYPAIPRDYIAAEWIVGQQRKLDARVEETDEKEQIKQMKINEGFLQRLYNNYGTFNGDAQFIPGVTIADFERATDQDKVKYRRLWENEYYKGTKQIANSILKFMQRINTGGKVAGSMHGDDDLYTPDKNTQPDPGQVDATDAEEGLPDAAGVEETPVGLTAPLSGAEPLRPTFTVGPQPTAADSGDWARDAKHLQPFVQRIAYAEGFHKGAKPAKADGKVTIGYGRNIDDWPLTNAEKEHLGFPRDLNKKPLTHEESVWLLEKNVKEKEGEASLAFRDVWPTITREAQEVIVDMTYNMGVKKMQGFNRMFAALREIPPDYETAAKEMLLSDWYNQVGDRRAGPLYEVMKGQ